MEIVLSTAEWGKSVDQARAFALLDRFVEAGGTYVETSVATPSTGRPEDFAGATRMLKKWLRTRTQATLKIFCTIGFLDNRPTPDRKISSSAILTETELVRGRTFDSLCGIRIDCGTDPSQDDLAECLSAMRYLRSTGLEVGLNTPPSQSFVSKMDEDAELPWSVGLDFDASVQANITRLRTLLPQSKVILDLDHTDDPAFDDLSPDARDSVFGLQTSATSLSELDAVIASVSAFDSGDRGVGTSIGHQPSSEAL